MNLINIFNISKFFKNSDIEITKEIKWVKIYQWLILKKDINNNFNYVLLNDKMIDKDKKKF